VSKFAFKAVNEKGEQVFDVVEADNEKAALQAISELGLFPTEVHRAHIGDELRHGLQDRMEAERERREREERRRQREVRKRHARHSLVVRFKDGTVRYGVAFRFNHHESEFFLDCCDKDGHTLDERIRVPFSSVKAVFNVKSYNGKFNPEHFPPQGADGDDLVIEFHDGEVIKGKSTQPNAHRAERFFLVPHDETSNNITILVEGSAITFLGTPEEYKERRRKLREDTAAEKSAPPTQAETTGDFYFEMRDYDQALQHYLEAAKEIGESRRLKKKLLTTHYNIGMRFVKRRDFQAAIESMESVLAIDPRNEHARKKYTKLKKIIAHEASADDED
jgi:tetratricopeptide (TPR) repeat protein